MKDFLESIKKLLKIIFIIVLVIVALVSVVGGYNYYSDKVENTIDEEIGLLCDSPEKEAYIRMILSSSPKSRATSNYYDIGYIARFDESEIDETTEAKLLPMHIDKRTIDYVYADSLFGMDVKLNRKTLELSIIKKNQTNPSNYKVELVASCEEIDPQKIRDTVSKYNKESEEANKI